MVMPLDDDYSHKRQEMVRTQLLARGITDPATLEAMRHVPRHLFVPASMQEDAYEDRPLPIGEGQTISQPFIVALMNQLAEITPDSIVLDIGTGSGYAAAVAAYTAQEVYTVEFLPNLAHAAQECFKQLAYLSIHCKVADGSLGWPEHAPYDAIIVAAGAPAIPQTLIKQLKIGGRLIIPVGDSFSQLLLRLRKTSEETYAQETFEPVRFVPLIGKEGWES
ncbi:Protein-L-isoaspartate O-methyltransferase 2|nr:Protein-L-isoaspartate O-methyltransferase 2 [Neochlamydia sp. AcF84]